MTEQPHKPIDRVIWAVCALALVVIAWGRAFGKF